MEQKNSLLSTPLAVIVGSFVISFSILLSGGIVKLGKNINTTNVAGIQAQAAPQVPSQPNTPSQPEAPITATQVSMDDDPVIGDKNAPLTLIEFSDYECPFCKRHFEQTYPQLKKNYIDTGKVKLVFRDLPLPFHDPLATTEAIAANCAREQGGDEAYFKYHDEVFKKTTSNGSGLQKDDLYKIATDLGLNSGNLKTCIEAEKYKEEISKDLADASSSNANGTPSFFIGKSDSSGNITTANINPQSQLSIFKLNGDDGKLIGAALVGAQPYSQFQAVIDEMLK